MNECESCIIKSIFSFALTFLLFNIQILSQPATFINPGVKIGHTFGPDGGFTFGIEVSLVSYSRKDITEHFNNIGIVISIDDIRHMKKLHVGLESNISGFGVEIGPTITWDDDIDYGISITPYFGFIIIPYYSYTIRMKGSDLHEVGSYLKFPVLLSGRVRGVGG